MWGRPSNPGIMFVHLGGGGARFHTPTSGRKGADCLYQVRLPSSQGPWAGNRLSESPHPLRSARKREALRLPVELWWGSTQSRSPGNVSTPCTVICQSQETAGVGPDVICQYFLWSDDGQRFKSPISSTASRVRPARDGRATTGKPDGFRDYVPGPEMGKLRAIGKTLEQRGHLARSYAATREVPSRFGQWAAGNRSSAGWERVKVGWDDHMEGQTTHAWRAGEPFPPASTATSAPNNTTTTAIPSATLSLLFFLGGRRVGLGARGRRSLAALSQLACLNLPVPVRPAGQTMQRGGI